MNRLDRLTALLIQLQSKRVVKSQEFAERFGVSLRTVYRNFRTDRVESMEVLTKRFETQHPALQKFIEQTRRERTLQKATVRVDKSALCWMGDQHYYHGFVSQTDVGDQIEMTFLTESLNGLAHWFLWLGGQADIVEPEKLRELVLNSIKKVDHRLSEKVSELC